MQAIAYWGRIRLNEGMQSDGSMAVELDSECVMQSPGGQETNGRDRERKAMMERWIC